MNIALGVVLAYLLGSIPTAFLAGKISKGIDLRRFGSGNLGATNVYRLLGSQLAALVWITDTAKGAAPVLFLPGLLELPDNPLLPIALGIVAIVGHVRPTFLERGGGKGVATAMGVFLALTWLPTVLAIVTWGVVLWRSGYVSLASIVAAATLAVSALLLQGPRDPEVIAAAGVAAFVIWAHRENIARLRRGEERRFRADRSSSGAGDAAGAGHPRGRP